MLRSDLRAALLGLLLALLVLPVGEFTAFARQQPPPQKDKQEPQKPPQQAPEVAISVEVPVVNVDVVVTDNRGTYVTNLKKENFRILEDGVPQTITNFAPTEAPITIVVLIEFSKLGYEYFAYKSVNGAYLFLNQLKKDDWVALVSFDLRTRIEVDFTRNKAQVQQHLSRMYFPGFSESNVFDALTETIDRLEDVKGKKAILLLASGIDTFSKKTLDDTLKRLKTTDVTIFTVGVARDFWEYVDAQGGFSGSWGAAGRMTFLQAENQLAAFARLTGGRSWAPRFDGELNGIFQDVAASLRSQYSIGYSPSNQSRDGKFRKIKVQLVSEDGTPLVFKDQNQKNVKVMVYAREGYNAPKGKVGD
jgi:VWFA-related protein